MDHKKANSNPRTPAVSGKWLVAEMPDLDDDYLDLTPDPHVVLKTQKTRKDVSGDYEFGAQSGEIDGKLETTPGGETRLTFTFEGQDELDPVHGYGEVTLVDEDTLKGYMRYHLGDTYRFVWKRAPE